MLMDERFMIRAGNWPSPGRDVYFQILYTFSLNYWDFYSEFRQRPRYDFHGAMDPNKQGGPFRYLRKW